jgi:two-component system CheB/CheR fusion protein
VHADPARLQQVFWNLLSNAIKFTAPGGRIEMRCQTRDAGELKQMSGQAHDGCRMAADEATSAVVVEVSDSGVGIEPEMLGRVFDAFEQGGRGVTRQFGGLGLGLAISRKLVELHGGRITAHSEGVGKGAMFRVVLPAIAAPASTAIMPGARSEGPAVSAMRVAGESTAGGGSGGTEAAGDAGRAPTGKPRILLVEDHIDTVRVMSQLLRRRGYEVQTACTVEAALRLAEQEPFDVLVSDLGLPDGNGLQLLNQVRARFPAVKAIAISGYGMEEDIKRSREAGFMDHLTKPVDVGRLREAIARVAGAGAQ